MKAYYKQTKKKLIVLCITPPVCFQSLVFILPGVSSSFSETQSIGACLILPAAHFWVFANSENLLVYLFV